LRIDKHGRRKGAACIKGFLVLFLELYLQIPDDNTTVDTTGADLANGIGRTSICADSADRILVDSLELCIVNDFAAEVHLSEHIESRLVALVRCARL
jgi:hypothetical protein